ncbi:universal stress protein [Tepidiforma sp.]|uniref:universal stress protein n=1 Tax=Tepidiforma sp. TaxID=2682230 RepID=UPI002ADE3BD5|nr:universal stress protein [Tepidiforma sp.]
MDNWRTFLVPVTCSRASMEAVQVAASLAKARRAQVVLVHVIEVRRSLPLNAELDAETRRGEQVIQRAEAAAAAAGCPSARGILVQAREAGPALLEEARDRNADVIILGLPPFEGEDRPFALGRTAEFLLRHAPCEVWLIRRPMRDIPDPGGFETP